MRHSDPRLDAIFGALSDPTRRSILAQLAEGECSVTDLWEPFDVSAPAISKHLRVLESSGLISRRKEGRVNYCCLKPQLLQDAQPWIEQQRTSWERQLDGLDKCLTTEKASWRTPSNRSP